MALLTTSADVRDHAEVAVVSNVPVRQGHPAAAGWSRGSDDGRDVDIAARITDAAGPGEVCVSSPVREHLAAARCAVAPLRGRRGKGVPPDITPWRVDRTADPSRD